MKMETDGMFEQADSLVFSDTIKNKFPTTYSTKKQTEKVRSLPSSDQGG